MLLCVWLQNPTFRAIHCVAHRLALSLGESACKVSAVHDVLHLLDQISHYYKTSPIRTAGFHTIQVRWTMQSSYLFKTWTLHQSPLYNSAGSTFFRPWDYNKSYKGHSWWLVVAQKHWILIVRLCDPFHDSSMFSGWLVAPQAYTIYTSCVLIIPRLKATLNKISVNAQSPFKSFNCL